MLIFIDNVAFVTVCFVHKCVFQGEKNCTAGTHKLQLIQLNCNAFQAIVCSFGFVLAFSCFSWCDASYGSCWNIAHGNYSHEEYRSNAGEFQLHYKLLYHNWIHTTHLGIILTISYPLFTLNIK